MVWHIGFVQAFMFFQMIIALGLSVRGHGKPYFNEESLKAYTLHPEFWKTAMLLLSLWVLLYIYLAYRGGCRGLWLLGYTAVVASQLLYASRGGVEAMKKKRGYFPRTLMFDTMEQTCLIMGGFYFSGSL